jgi:uncharacterized protein (TIGR02270 family)
MMSADRFIADIVEQHYENAASLWHTRDSAVGASSSFRLSDLVRLDERVEANIDGLRIAAARGWAPSSEELDRNSAGDFFVAGVLALESQSTGKFDEITEQAYAAAARQADEPDQPAYDPWRGLVSALAWVPHSLAAGAIHRLLDTPRPRTRWLGVAACGARRLAGQPNLEAALADPEPLVRARAARTMGELGRRDQHDPLCALLSDEDSDARFWAAWSGTRLGVSSCVPVLSEFARATSPRCDQALELLCRRLAIHDANALVRPLGSAPEWRRTLIRAVGTIGDAIYLPWLVRQAAEPSSARAALASFALITGLTTAEFHAEAPPDTPETVNDDPRDETVVPNDADALPWPDAERLARWWHANQGRFNAGTSYFLGRPKMSAHWLDALTNAPQWLRRMAALELALRMPSETIFEVKARGSAQQQMLRQVNTSN